MDFPFGISLKNPNDWIEGQCEFELLDVNQKGYRNKILLAAGCCLGSV
jgi:hypothetical protein